MSERYTRLFTLPKDRYVRHAPVLVEAGALLKDNENGQVIGQLKILNLQDKPIKATTVAFLPFDTAGKVLGQEFEYQYLDLNTKKNQTFGEKTPVKFPDSTTRAFLPAVLEVVFEDNSKWSVSANEVWDPLPKQETLESALGDTALKVQYQKETSAKSTFCPEDCGEIWRCACGAVNSSSNRYCRTCQTSKNDVFLNFNAQKLQQDRASFIQESEEIIQKEKQLFAKRKRKVKIIAGGFLVLVICITLIITTVIPSIAKEQKYNTALAYSSEGLYSDAIALFQELGSYKDSQENLFNCRLGDYLNNSKYIEAAMLLIQKLIDPDTHGVNQDFIDVLDLSLSYEFENTLGEGTCGTIYKIEYYSSNTALVYCSGMKEGHMTMGSSLSEESTIALIGITPEEIQNSYLIAEGDLIRSISFEMGDDGQYLITSN
ncbi:uncharacterized protein BN452_01689 [Clostridium sp. CAG:1013]|nr:uncharacterized protein BN452_01689 [Clostridium sp. CAG:1013]